VTFIPSVVTLISSLYSEAVNTSFEIHDRKIASLEQEVLHLRALSCPLPPLKTGK
jgi:hypothetical protein